MYSTDDPCVTDYFFIFNVQMIDLISQNNFHIQI
jgi:hypothetical protein